ncbi:MAG: substrate-binding domain-containing protein [Thermoanaerobaculia bacterium]
MHDAFRPWGRIVCGVLCAAAVSAAGTEPMMADGTLSYEGATTIGTNIMPRVAALFTAATGVRFRSIGGAGADAGFQAAVEGRATFGGLARELTAEEKARVGGYEVIGYDVMGVFVNAANPVAGLTRAELREIFTGRATGWRQFGGPNLPITVYSERLSGGRATVRAFRDMVLGGDPYGPVREREDATDCVGDVAADAGGVTASSMSFAIRGVRALSVDGSAPVREAVQRGAYPLKRPLILVTKDVPAGDAKAFLDFMLTPEAQAIIGTKFVPAK